MAKRGGFPGAMPGNMNNLMKQAQKMQRQMEETTKQLEEVTKVTIDPEAVDTDDIEMLEDMIMAATNEALRQIEELSQASMAKITGGLGGLGGGFPF